MKFRQKANFKILSNAPLIFFFFFRKDIIIVSVAEKKNHMAHGGHMVNRSMS